MNRPIAKSNTTNKNNPIVRNKISFGPSLKESKPLQVKCSHIKKLIHYDCYKKKMIQKKMIYRMKMKYM